MYSCFEEAEGDGKIDVEERLKKIGSTCSNRYDGDGGGGEEYDTAYAIHLTSDGSEV